MTDSSGTVVWSADYKPFGEATITVSTINNNLRFPGQYFDQETGLYYNYFRDYNPALDRYIEGDPIGLKSGINLFLYAKANSLKYTDKFGLLYGGTGAVIQKPAQPPTPPKLPPCLKTNYSKYLSCLNDKLFDPSLALEIEKCIFSPNKENCLNAAGSVALPFGECWEASLEEVPRDKCGNCP